MTMSNDYELYNVKYAKMYAEKVCNLNNTSAEIAWLFSKLPREEQDSLVEIFNLKSAY